MGGRSLRMFANGRAEPLRFAPVGTKENIVRDNVVENLGAKDAKG